MAVNDYTRASHVEVEVEYALAESGGTFGEYQAMGCLVGTVAENINAEETEVDINTWCEIQARNSGAPGLRQTTAGELDYTLTGEMAVIVKANSAWNALRAAIVSREQLRVRLTYSDSNETPNSFVTTLQGYLTNFNVQSPEDGISTSPFTIRVLEVIT